MPRRRRPGAAARVRRRAGGLHTDILSLGEWVALAAFALGGLLQSATGYGFAILASPVLAGVETPERAIPTLAVVGTLLNVVMLLHDDVLRRRAAPGAGGEADRADVGLAGALLAGCVPGTAAGAALLLAAPREVLRALIAVAVLTAAAARAARPRVVGPRGRETAVAGVLAGVLGGSVGFNGPPAVLLLLRRGTSPGVTRTTLAAFFVGSGSLTALILFLAGAFDLLGLWPVLLAAAVAGQLAGRGLRPALAAHHEPATLAVLAFSGLVALASAVASLA